MWCPKCKYEYQKNMTHCPDCGAPLVPQKPEQTKEAAAPWPAGADGKPDSETLLCHVNSELEANMMLAQLQAYGIPARKIMPSIPGSGLFKIIMGMSSTGFDLYVPEAMYSTAEELVGREYQSSEEPAPFDGQDAMEVLTEENDLFFSDIILSELDAAQIAARREEVSPFLCRIWAEKGKIEKARGIYAKLTAGEEKR